MRVLAGGSSASIALGTVHDVLSCNETAISFEDGKPYVYVLISSPDDIANQKFERRAVTIGLSDGLFIELKDGVKSGRIWAWHFFFHMYIMKHFHFVVWPLVYLRFSISLRSI